MTRLLPVLPYDPAETALSYLGRVAAIHTGLPSRQILADLGIDRRAYLAGREPAVTDFATATGVDPAALGGGAITITTRSNDFRGASHSKDFLSSWVDRVCPACLAEDGRMSDRKHRLLWCYRMVRVCPVHCVALVRIDDGKGTDLRTLPGACDRILGSPSDTGARPVHDHVDWIDARLRLDEDLSSWMAGQTCEQVLAASEVIGAVLDHGAEVRVQCLGEDARDAATQTGFAIYAAGPEAVRDAISTIRDRAGVKAAQAGPLAMYGRLYDWLNTRSSLIDPGPIRTILRDHIVEHSAVASGESILGEVVETRRFHSLASLAGKTGLSPRKLIRLLEKRGLVEVGATPASSGATVFPVAEVERLCADLEDPILLQDVAEYVSGTRSQVTALYAAGVLKPIFPADSAGEFKMVSFARRHLDDLVADIAGLPELIEEDGKTFGTLALACQGGAGFTADVLPKVLAGEMEAWRDPERRGIASIRMRLVGDGRPKATGSP